MVGRSKIAQGLRPSAIRFFRKMDGMILGAKGHERERYGNRGQSGELNTGGPEIDKKIENSPSLEKREISSKTSQKKQSSAESPTTNPRKLG